MDEREDLSPSATCRICDRPSIPGSWACPRCRSLLDRVDTRAGRLPDKAARRRAMRDQWSEQRKAFLRAYTGVELSETYGNTRYATWEHRDASDESSVVLCCRPRQQDEGRYDGVGVLGDGPRARQSLQRRGVRRVGVAYEGAARVATSSAVRGSRNQIHPSRPALRGLPARGKGPGRSRPPRAHRASRRRRARCRRRST